MTDLTTLPLYDVERHSLTLEGAPEELARRYVVDRVSLRYTAGHMKRVHTAWLTGWRGEPNPYSNRNNFTAPYSTAWRRGKDKRHELEAALNGGAW